MFWLPMYIFILAQNKYIQKQNVKVCYVNMLNFFIGVTMMIATKR